MMSRMVLVLLVVLMFVATALPREGAAGEPKADFHVAPTGDDSGPGTLEKPFATLARARDAVRERIAKGLDKNLLVLVRSGTYRTPEPIVFGPEDSGTERHAVTYAASGRGRAVISGGRAITGWKQDGEVWKATIPQVKAGRWTFRELFVGGARRPRARHPNKGYIRVEKVIDDRRSFTYTAGDLPALGDVGEAELLLLHDWSVTRNRIGSIDAKTRTVTSAEQVGGPAGFWRINGFEPHPRFGVENHPALLDAPGEWYLERKTGVLVYRPVPGETIESIEIVAPVAKQLLVVRGDLETKRRVRNLRFKGFAFEHCSWLTTGGRYGGGQACFHFGGPAKQGWGWQPVTPAILLEGAEACVFDGCRIARLGGSGIWFARGCRDCEVQHGTVTDVSGNGVMIGEGKGRKEGDVATGNEVANCRITDCGRQFFGAVGVWVGLAADNVLRHNEIGDHPYTGVSVGWMWNPTPTPCKGNIVSDNHIHHCMQILSDGGGIYTLGLQPGTALRGNLIHDIPLNAGRAESNGMFLDEGTTSLVIEDNVIFGTDRSPFRFHKATTNLLQGNVVVLRQGVPIVRYNATDPKHITLRGNAEFSEADVEKAAFKEAVESKRRTTGPRPEG